MLIHQKQNDYEKIIKRKFTAGSLRIALFLGCKKDTFKEDKANLEIENSVPVAEASVQGSLSVSDYGFLKFETYNQFEEYLNFLKTESHSKVKDVLQEVGFTCPGFNNYGVEYESENVTDEQLVNYIISEDSVVQIAGVIFRPVNNYAYLITMDPSELNLETYVMLQSGSFEIDRMNRFLIVANDDQCFDLFDFIRETPFGHDELSTPASRRRCNTSIGSGEACPPWALFGEKCFTDRFYPSFTERDGTVHFVEKEFCCKHTFGIPHHCDYKK